MYFFCLGRGREENREAVKKMNVCIHAKKCGACQYQGMDYEEQLKEKHKKVQSLLKTFGKAEPILGMDDPYFYRNKVHAALKRLKTGEIISGIYEEGTHRIVPITNCQIEDPRAGEVIQTVAKLAKSFKIKIYNEDAIESGIYQ